MKTLKIIFFLATLLILPNLHAQEISVVDVKRNITLADDDPVYKDFYINAGEGSTLKKNLVVNVKRKINVKDSGTKTVGDFETTVGQLKIIQVGSKVSVAREFKLIPRDEEAMLEQVGIMAGDHIDLNGSFIDYSKPKHKNSEAEPKKEESSTKTADASGVMPAIAPADTHETKTAPREPSSEPKSLLQKIIPIPGM